MENGKFVKGNQTQGQKGLGIQIKKAAIPPIGDVYEYDVPSIKEFINELFISSGIDGYVLSAIAITKETLVGQNAEGGAQAIVIIKGDSADIKKGGSFFDSEEIASVFRNRDEKKHYMPSAKLEALLGKVCKPFKIDNDRPKFRIECRKNRVNQKEFIIKLDILRVLALMAGSNPRTNVISLLRLKVVDNVGVIIFTDTRRKSASSIDAQIYEEELKMMAKKNRK